MCPSAVRANPLAVVVAERRVAVTVMGEGPGESITACIYFSSRVDAFRNHVKKLRPSFIRDVLLQACKNRGSIRGQVRSNINLRIAISTAEK